MKAVVLLCLLSATFLRASSEFSWNGRAKNAGRAATAPNYGWNGKKGNDVASEADEVCLDKLSCSCCIMAQEVNRMEATFNDTLAELEMESSTVTRALDHITNRRAAFSASLWGNHNFYCATPITVDDIISYKNVFLNLGNAYSSTTGIFTAPFTGIYSVSVTVYSDAGSEKVELRSCASLMVNGDEIVSAKDKNKFDQEDSATIAVALQLTAGDEVFVKSSSDDCLLCGRGRYNTFSAFLLHVIE